MRATMVNSVRMTATARIAWRNWRAAAGRASAWKARSSAGSWKRRVSWSIDAPDVDTAPLGAAAETARDTAVRILSALRVRTRARERVRGGYELTPPTA